MRKGHASAANKPVIDKKRDQLIMGFMQNIKAEKIVPDHPEANLAAINEVIRVAEKYGTKIIRLSYNEETAAVDNLLADLKKKIPRR